jgi:WD40 repeat protein
LKLHDGIIQQARYSPDDKLMVSVGESKKIIIYDIQKKSVIKTIAGI